jgi:hypothetical protein
MDGEHRIEEMRQPDSVRFGGEPKQLAVPVEAPGFPFSATCSRPSSERYRTSLLTRPAGSLYVSSAALSPYHWTLTTVTRASGRMPRTATLGRRSSNFMN